LTASLAPAGSACPVRDLIVDFCTVLPDPTLVAPFFDLLLLDYDPFSSTDVVDNAAAGSKLQVARIATRNMLALTGKTAGQASSSGTESLLKVLFVLFVFT